MRVKLVKGNQEKLILLAKNGKTWNKLADEIDINEAYLRTELRKELRLLPGELYNKLCKIAKVNFDSFILERLNDNWGRSKGGRLSLGKTKKIKFPSESESLAELYGIMLGDGCLQMHKGYKVGTYNLKIVGDQDLDKEYHLNYIKPLLENLFEVNVRAGLFKGTKARFLEVNGINLINFFIKKGFKPGNKIKNKLIIPFWIKNNNLFLRACLRGIYDTDGGIYKLNNQNTYQIVFTNNNSFLLKDVRNSLIHLGISPSKIVAGNRIYITKKSELRKFLKLIGFSNSRHSNKVKMFKLAP